MTEHYEGSYECGGSVVCYSSDLPCPSYNVLEAVVINAIANDHSGLFGKLSHHFYGSTQALVLPYLIASKKNGSVLGQIISLIIPDPEGVPHNSLRAVHTRRAFLEDLGNILAMGREKKISIVSDYILSKSFDLDTAMLVWEALGLNESVADDGVAKEAAIASLEKRMCSLSDGEVKGTAEAFRNKIRESR